MLARGNAYLPTYPYRLSTISATVHTFAHWNSTSVRVRPLSRALLLMADLDVSIVKVAQAARLHLKEIAGGPPALLFRIVLS